MTTYYNKMSFTLPWTVNKLVSTYINAANSITGTYGNVSLKVNGDTELVGNVVMDGHVAIGCAPDPAIALLISPSSQLRVDGNAAFDGSLVVFASNTQLGINSQIVAFSYLPYFNNTTYPTVNSSSFVTKALTDSYYVGLSGTQTVAGVKTFSSPPVMSGASITSGTIPDAALSANVALKNGTNTWSGTNTFNTNLPTSTKTPTTGTQLITKTYADSTYAGTSTVPTLSGSNTFTGTKNTFTQSVDLCGNVVVTRANVNAAFLANVKPLNLGTTLNNIGYGTTFPQNLYLSVWTNDGTATLIDFDTSNNAIGIQPNTVNLSPAISLSISAPTTFTSYGATFNNCPLTITSSTPAINSNGTAISMTQLAYLGALTNGIVDTSGNQSINGVKTFLKAPVMSGASITSASIPDTALSSNVLLKNTNSTITGVYTFSSTPVFNSSSLDPNYIGGMGMSAGSSNAWYGYNAGGPGGANNTAIGDTSMFNGITMTGTDNTGCGTRSLSSISSQSNNTAVGSSALQFCTSSNNTAVGQSAGGSLSATSSNNTLIGYNAAYASASFSNCSVLGANSSVASNTSYATAIGANVNVTTSNTIKIGRTNDTTIFDGSFTMTSKPITLSGTNALVAGSTIVTSAQLGYLGSVTTGIVDTGSNQTVGGIKTFSLAPVMSGASITSGTIPDAALSTNVGLKNGTNAWAGTNSFNTNLPTSTLTPSTGTQLITKTYADSTYAPTGSYATLGGSNAYTGTNTFNTNLPTSTLTPSLGTQLITKTYADSTYAPTGSYVTLGGTNAWTGTNSFNTNLPTSTLTPSLGTQLITKNFADASYVNLVTAQTVAGIKTFSSAPVMSGASITSGTIPDAALSSNVGLINGSNGWSGTNTFNTNLPTSTLTPTTGTQLITKNFADASYVNLVSAQTVAGIKTFSSPPVMSGASITSGTIPDAALSSNVGLINGSNAWSGTNTFNTNLPTSTLTPTTGTQLITKNFADASYVNLVTAQTVAGIKTFSSAPVMSGASITATSIPDTALSSNVPLRSANNAFTGTNTFNSNLPTSTLVAVNPNQFTTKSFCDSTYSAIGTVPTLSGTNTFSGQNTFSGNLITTTQSLGNSSTFAASTAFVQNQINNLLYASTVNQNYAFQLPEAGYPAPFSQITTGTYNYAAGPSSLRAVTSGSGNFALGGQCLYTVTTGSDNQGIGHYSLSNTNGSSNVGIGTYCLFNTSTSQNTVIGYFGAVQQTTGSATTGIGYQNFFNLKAGSNNTGVGQSIGAGIVNGSNNTFLGSSANAGGDYSNTTAIGYNAVAGANNEIAIGTSAENTKIYGSLTVNSTIQNGVQNLNTAALTGTTSPYTIAATMPSVVLCQFTANGTINLPALSSSYIGFQLTIRKIGTLAITLTIARNGTNTIMPVSSTTAGTTLSLSNSQACVSLVATSATNWAVLYIN